MAIFCKPTAIQLLTIMVFWGQIQNYMMRANVSILIVAMVKDTITNSASNVTHNVSSLTCLENRNRFNQELTNKNDNEALGQGESSKDHLVTRDDTNNESDRFDWGPFKQGLVLAAVS